MTNERDFKPLATDVLTTFSKVSNDAHEGLIRGTAGPSMDSIVNVDEDTAEAVRKEIKNISDKQIASLKKLRHEPAIARVICETDEGKKTTYFICRGTPNGSIVNLASYDAPIGSLASQEVGDEIVLPNGRTLELVERVLLSPRKEDDEWDSIDSEVYSKKSRTVTISSLAAFLGTGQPAEIEDMLSKILAEEQLSQNVVEGIKRRTITNMSLRDRPILDKYQNEIFRLPIDKQLIILGPPGTGKTTTLIKRLGQKLNPEHLSDHEKNLVDRIERTGVESHQYSWLMFSPTDLLKEYLQEAFARERVPAPDQNISTWENYRLRIAKDPFSILKTAVGGGPFILKDETKHLKTDTQDRPTDWLAEFKISQHMDYVSGLQKSADALSMSPIEGAANLGRRLIGLLSNLNSKASSNFFSTLSKESAEIQALVTTLRDSSERLIKASLNFQLNHDREFLGGLAVFVDELNLEKLSENLGDLPVEQDEEDIDEEEAPSKSPISGAITKYKSACRRVALDKIKNKKTSSKTQIGRIIEWLGSRIVEPEHLSDLGHSIEAQRQARIFLNPLKRYIERMPARYRSYRSKQKTVGQWYSEGKSASNQIAPRELDLILCSLLQLGQHLLQAREVRQNLDTSTWSVLKPVYDLYRNQILVDEATDFSPLQLGSMAALSHPLTQSFFACGDFNQRLTNWGAKSRKEIEWVCSNIEVREVRVGYRQSKPLTDLAQSLLSESGMSASQLTLPDYSDLGSYLPVLLEGARTIEEITLWLSDRIREINKNVGYLPSIAIFVNDESEVCPLSEALRAALVDVSIGVEACESGKVRGQDSNVRVFDIQHIKGLEFEAVFFVGVDALAIMKPQLFDKYLYVGVTRAATYLGLTCETKLPENLGLSKNNFIEQWT